MKYLISKGQIKLIHVLKSEARLTDEDYRSLLKGKFNVNSCLQLTEAQASVCCRLLREWTGKKASKKQIARLNYLFDDAGVANKDDFIMKNIGYRIGVQNLTVQECSKLIFILEKIIKWKKEQAHGE